MGDKADTHLTPPKLAAFYKAVGGNYDCMCTSEGSPNLESNAD